MAEPTPKLPETIGRFRVQAMLGRGAMGVVYRAHDPDIDRQVAIKLIRVDLLDGADRAQYLARFRNEARAAGRCQHPHIVALHDFALHDGNPYLVMEYVEGHDLGSAYERGKQLDVGMTGQIALRVLDALGYAHGLGIVHRDIKPANILLTDMAVPAGPGVKVADFGISRLVAPNATQSSIMVGTPSYMSPEQCRGESVDQRCDLFSLGCVLHEMLGGARAFHGASYVETIYRLVHDPHVPLGVLRPAIPAAVAAVVDRALAKRPEHRFADAREMAAAWAAAISAPATTAADTDSGGTVVLRGRLPPRSKPTAPLLDAIDPAKLSGVERYLAQHFGPIAGFQLRQAMREANSADDLGRRLSAMLPDGSRNDPDWQSRLAAMTRDGLSRGGLSGEVGPDRSGTPAPDAAGWKVQVVDTDVRRTTRTLAGFIGPIAGYLVSVALSRATTRQEFEQLCAAAIDSKPARERFLAMLAHPR